MANLNPTLKARQAVAKAAKDVCDGKTGAKSKLAAAKKKALAVAKASIEKLANTCATKKKAAPKKRKPAAKKPTTRKKTTAKR